MSIASFSQKKPSIALPASGENRAALASSVLEGSLERITYANAENAWSVVRVAVPGRKEPVTVVGNLLGAQPGESLRVTGFWVHDKKYGEQFRAVSYQTVTPATLVGVEKYLGSGLIRGVGPGMAARLVKHFGLETLDVIDTAPQRLQEVEGIGPKRGQRIVAAWAEQREIRQVMVFLQSHGVSATFAVKVYKQYGAQAVCVVQENPYRLAIDIYGIGFKTADTIAKNLGIPAESPRRAEAGLLHVLGEFSEEGHVYAPRGKLTAAAVEILGIDAAIVQKAIDAMAATEHVVVEDLEGDDRQAVYLKSLHTAEVGIASLLRALVAAPMKPIQVDVDKAIAWFEEKQGLTLAPEQQEAIRQAIFAKAMVITGGPGTGKTTLVNGILSILEKKARRLLLAAPTGRAAKRMSEATGRPAETIHRLLKFSPKTNGFERNRHNPLEADVLVLDEASMLDTVLALNVLKAVPPHCQLLLVGDVDQLPSVGPGNVLSDVIESGAVPVVRLQQIFRQAERSLITTNAHRINEGQLPKLPPSEATSDFYFVEKEEPEAILSAVKRLVSERIPQKFGLHPLDDVQVLVPMNRALLGTASLNAELQAHLNPTPESLTRGSRTFRVGDKVMQIRNNYDLDVFNGDVGRVVSIDPIEQQVVVQFDGRTIPYEYADLDELTLAYAVSIHKSQGSEYPCVVLPLHTQHYPLLQRNLLYTGVTRGKRLVVLVGSKRALAIAVRNGNRQARHTRLSARLAAPHSGKEIFK